jgi:uncharacterized YigZ family protein
MAELSRYPVPASTHRVQEEIGRSRFITTVGRAASVEEAAEFIRRVSQEYPDATHHCWAYVVGAPGTTSHIGMSDAGEPHGTAGRPMLTALVHGGVGDVVAVVTRYYGGTKLGTGGLVRAYGGGVQQALLSLPRTEHVERVALVLTIAYSRYSAVQQLFEAYEVEVVSEDYLADVSYRVRLPRDGLDRFRAAVMDATRGEARVVSNDKE